MARYTDPVCRLCRREGIKLFLKGPKCFSDKCPLEKRNFAPGQHGKDRKAKIVGYGLQLREKQKTKRMYFAQEGQFRNYFEKAARAPGVTGELLLQQLERRLDTVVHRIGFGISRRQARQLVRHGHVHVDGRKVNIPSYQVNAVIVSHMKPRKSFSVPPTLQFFFPGACSASIQFQAPRVAAISPRIHIQESRPVAQTQILNARNSNWE